MQETWNQRISLSKPTRQIIPLHQQSSRKARTVSLGYFNGICRSNLNEVTYNNCAALLQVPEIPTLTEVKC